MAKVINKTIDKKEVAKLSVKFSNELLKFKQAAASMEETLGKLNVAVLTEDAPVSEVKRGRGRPRKNEESQKNKTTETTMVVGVRRRGRPRKNTEASTQTKITVVHRGPGRPRKTETTEQEPVVAKRSPGRPRKNAESVVAVSQNNDIISQEIEAINKDLKKYNSAKWQKENQMWVKENATYRAEIVGAYSNGTSGKYGITTRVYLNPQRAIIPEDLKHHISTAAVNRIRYVGNEEEGLEYIEKQKAKIVEDFFAEVMPKVIPDHGKEDSVYAFHLKPSIREAFNQLKTKFDETSTTIKNDKKKVVSA